MIVARVPGEGGSALRVVTQNDHAHLAAEVLSLWRAGGLPDHPRRETILLAAREHDNGWREHDAAPRVDPATGRPRDFRTTLDADRREIWHRGVSRHRDSEPAAALLILAHARHLHADHAGDGAWRPLLEAWRGLESELTAALGMDAATLAADYRFIDLSDIVSLALADRWRDALEYRDCHLAPRPAGTMGGVDTLALEPFPLAGATTFSLPCRVVEERAFASDLDLGTALAEARWQRAKVRLVPAL